MALSCMKRKAPSPSDEVLLVGIDPASAVFRALEAVLEIFGFEGCAAEGESTKGDSEILVVFDLGLRKDQSPAIFRHYGSYLQEPFAPNATLPVPVILTDRSWTDLRRDGFDVPEDLVVPLWPATDKPTSSAIVELLQRLPYLKAVWGRRMTQQVLRDILVGALRRDLGIGIGHHDTQAEFGTWVRSLATRVAGGSSATPADRDRLSDFALQLKRIRNRATPSGWQTLHGLFESDLARYDHAIKDLEAALPSDSAPLTLTAASSCS